MKTLNKSLFLVVLLAFPVVSFGQILDIGGGSATKIEASGEGVVTPEGSPMEIPIRYTGDVNKPPSANSSIEFNLKVGEKTLFSRLLGMTIALNSLTRNRANVSVTTVGGCGPNADPLCLGAPGFEETFNLRLGELKIIPGTGASLTFAQKLSKHEAIFILTTPISRPFPTPTPTEPPTSTPTPTSTPNCPTDSYWDSRSNICRPTGPYPTPTPTPTPTFILRPAIAPVIHKVIEVQQIESGSYQVKAKQRGRVLFLVPVEINVSYSVEGSATTNVKRPWWSFLVW